MPDPYVVSVILNMDRLAETRACLTSLSQSTYHNQAVLVLDLSSNHENARVIRREFPIVQVIELTENLGYAGNNNIGIAEALRQGADWVFVLNEDTTQSVDCLSEMIRCGMDDSQVGVVGPMVYHADEPEVIQSAGGTIDPYFRTRHLGQNEKDDGKYQKNYEVDWVTGCAILVRRAAVEQVGRLDERFFLYNEEVEWCIRIKEAGWKIMLTPEAKLWHKGVQRNYNPKPYVTYYLTRNKLLTLRLHQASLAAWWVNCFDIFRSIISWTVKPRWKEMRGHRDASWRGVVDFWGQKWGKMR
jgi:GT2 family glycosyltransferase